jgi:acetyl-CoA C-acetyltransferase
MHGKRGPEWGAVYGRLEATGERFLANPPADPAVLWDLQNRESLGRPGTVSQVEGRNVFVPAA